ncbi:hypothetical protein FGG78_18885 [Thioclava sp. BHET1]|nr:hypothetical protein FGG78_18885 [Thioclava sp. BHET1]
MAEPRVFAFADLSRVQLLGVEPMIPKGGGGTAQDVLQVLKFKELATLELFGLIVSFLGILLAFISIALTYITFFAPGLTAKFALRDEGRWSEVTVNRPGHKFLRHEVFSGFSIEIDFTDPVAEEFFEPWMRALYRPDRSASSYYVTMCFNGLPILTELFVSYDGSRNFIPAPKTRKVSNKHYLHFDQIQRLLGRVVGYVHLEDSVDQVIDKILKSRYNPVFTDFDIIDGSLSIVDLDQKIAEFKKRAKLLGE